VVELLDDGRTNVAGHNQDRVFEIDRPSLAVGEAAVIEDLQQHIEHIMVRLFDFIEEHDAVRPPADRFA